MCKTTTEQPAVERPPIKWEELKSHNCPDNAWTAVHGNVYDIEKFANTHPGGDLILLGAGKDASVRYFR